MSSNELWMSTLPEDVRNISIINIAIPGSHNTMTYGITTKIAPDATKTTRRLNRVFPFFVKKWAKTQSASIQDQLKLGVRYFDLRVCQLDDKFYYTHGLLAMEVCEPLEEINQFLSKNPAEFVILDFQHFYDMAVSHHLKLHANLIELFGKRIFCTTDGQITQCTLNYCRDRGKQVFMIYRRCPVSLPKEFWPSYVWPTPWPNVASSKKLQEFLQNALASRKPIQGYVSQCILTPTGRYIALRFLSSLRKTARKVDKSLQPWIVEQVPGPFADREPPRVNVFIGDFVNLKDGQFCDWVIGLNMKLDKAQEQAHG